MLDRPDGRGRAPLEAVSAPNCYSAKFLRRHLAPASSRGIQACSFNAIFAHYMRNVPSSCVEFDMLVSFRVRNFKSFHQEATLNLTATSNDNTLPDAITTVEEGSGASVRLLSAAAIYGANASGKTNFLLAIDAFRRAISYSQSHWNSGSGTALIPSVVSSEEPTLFEAIFIVKGIRYRYGFLGNQEAYLQEWLYSYPIGRERLLFQRSTVSVDGEYKTTADFKRNLEGSVRDFDSSLRRTREDSLLLSAMSQDNQKDCQIVYEYFRDANSLITQKDDLLDSDYTSRFASSNKTYRNMVLGLLSTSDVAISDIELEKLPDMKLESNSDDQRALNPIYTTRFISSIAGKNHTLPIDVQSRGVKRIYATAASVCMSIEVGSLLIVDEIDTSMHPHMVAKLVSIFQNKSTNPNGSQLIFTTHDSHLMNVQHLRRDQVWFTEKNDGLSELYSLSEFSPRKNENLESGYLRGKFGAVPATGISLRLLGLDHGLKINAGNDDRHVASNSSSEG